MEDETHTDNIETIIQDAPTPTPTPEVVAEPVPPTPKTPKKRAKKTEKVKVVGEELQPEPVIVTEPVVEAVKETKPKAKRTSRATKKVEIEQTNVVEPETPQPVEQAQVNTTIQITPEMQEELVRNWITVQNNNKKALKQQKYKSMMAQAF